MKLRKRRAASTTIITAALCLGVAGASLADSDESPKDFTRDFRERMKGNAHFGGRHARRHRFPLAARPLVSIALRNHEELKLTDSQINRLKDVRDSFSKKFTKERAEMEASRIDLRRALDAEKIDFVDVEKRIRKIADMRVNLRIMRLKAIQEGKSILSAEQRKQLMRRVNDEHPRWRGGFRGHYGPGGRSQPY